MRHLVALLLTGVVGTWMCTASVPYRFKYVFRPGGSGSVSQLSARPTITSRFTYELSGAYIFMHWANGVYTREAYAVNDGRLVIVDKGYWHEDHWTPDPPMLTFSCNRLTGS